MLLGELSKDLLARPLTRNELLVILLRLSVFGVATYFSIKWVSDALDPTRKQRAKLKKKAECLMKQIGIEGVKLNEHEMSIAAHLVDPKDIQETTDEVENKKRQKVMVVMIQGLGSLEAEGSGSEDKTGWKDPRPLTLSAPALFMLKEEGELDLTPPPCPEDIALPSSSSSQGSKEDARPKHSSSVPLEPVPTKSYAFLRNRSDADHEATAMMKAEFMSLWDGLETGPNCQVMVLGATNRPQDKDPAILRRMLTTFQIGLPMNNAVSLKELAEKTKSYSGSDLRELCRDAAMYRVRDYVRKQQMKQIAWMLHEEDSEDDSDPEEQRLRPLTQHDLLIALDKMRESKGVSSAMLT